MTQSSPLKRRHPILVYLAGIPVPGLGFLLTGRLVPAIATAVTAMATLVLVPLLSIDVLDRTDLLPTLMMVSSLAVRLASSSIAAWLAFTDTPRSYRTFEHAWWAFGFALVVTVAWINTLKWVVPKVATIAYVLDTSLAPQAEPYTRVVITARGFDRDHVAINDLVAVQGGSPSWSGVADPTLASLPGFARVVATAGSVVEVDINGNVKVDGFPVIATPCPPTVPHHGRSCTVEKQATTGGTKERYTTATSFAREFPATSVGPGQVFVLPDDRGRKLTAPAGLIAVGDLAGRVVIAR